MMIPVTTREMMAMILIMANQNSVSPKSLAAVKLSRVKRPKTLTSISQAGRPGSQY